MPDDDRERAALIALLRQAQAGWPQIASDVLERGSAVELLEEALGARDALFPGPAGKPEEAISEAAEDLRTWDAAGLGVHTVVDESYPPQLREIRELPVVFTRGQPADDTRAIAVVGTRTASGRGLRIAGTLAGELARRNVTIVSGLAAGIDTAAHQAALAAGGRTVAVIGTGIQRYYPSANRALQDRIASDGLVISQFWPEAPPRKQHFPMRNAVMSGYAAATVVIEAGERSGARNQARLAIQHGRPVVLLGNLLVHEWAQRLAGRPGVTVADGPGNLLGVVDKLLEQRVAELSPEEGVAEFAIT